MADFRFKFKEINDEGQPRGLFSTKAVITDSSLVLGEDTVPLHQVIGADGHTHNAFVRWRTETGALTHHAFRVTGGGLSNVLRRINQACSRAKAGHRREYLSQQGRDAEYRDWTCPKCGSVVDLSGLEQTPQCWCPYCDALFTLTGEAPANESSFSCCEQCNLYAQPKPFTVFYFWFILVAFGYQYQVKRMCNVCMRKEVWKMLLVNFVFLVGTIPSLVQVFRAYFGGSKLSAGFRELDGANAAAHKGDFAAASNLYQRLLEKHPHSAGVFYNLGLAQFNEGNLDNAASALNASLNACINYAPAFSALCNLLETTGDSARLEHTRRRFLGTDYQPPQTAEGNAV